MGEHEESVPSTMAVATKNFVLLAVVAGISLAVSIYAGHHIANEVIAAHAADHADDSGH
ncbi:MAG: hypothetical protein VX405_06170 [Myxococcota bacterium]|jgi:hypothetical protein|nr:hypothetical protein [Myxococcota bacterium]